MRSAHSTKPKPEGFFAIALDHDRTAVDVIYLAGDVSRSIAGEKKNRPGNIVGLEHVAQRSRTQTCHGLFFGSVLARHVRIGRAGTNRVDGNALRTEFARQRLDQTDDGRLRSSIVGK